MGVDLTITRAVGVILDADGFKEFKERVDPDGNYWGEEYLELVPWEVEGIEFGRAGSYYASEPMTDYLYVRRVSKNWSEYDIPGGILEGPEDTGREVLTAREAVNLYNAAQEMGTKEPQIRTFTAVLWH